MGSFGRWRTVRRTVLSRATATAMLLLGWLVAGCAENAGVNGTEGARPRENGSIVHQGVGAPGSDAEIVFASEGIWTMDADGSNRTRVFDSAASDPAWSPDGRKIAFTRIVEESAAASATPQSIPSIVVMNADGSDQKGLLDAPASDPAWSPDGKKIAFSKSTPGGLSSIYVINADGSGDPKRLTTEPVAHDTDPAWSPDGTKIAFQSTRPDTPNRYPCPPIRREVFSATPRSTLSTSVPKRATPTSRARSPAASGGTPTLYGRRTAPR